MRSHPRRIIRVCALSILATPISGCGLTVPQLAEPYDRVFDKDATLHMEKQIKLSIWCELKDAVRAVRDDEDNKRAYVRYGTRVNTNVDGPLPDCWGAQMTLTFTVDEKTAFTPGVSFNTPMHDAPVNFVGEVVGADPITSAVTYGAKAVSQSYAFGLGGELSSNATRVDTYNSYYTIKNLAKQPPPPDVDACGPIKKRDEEHVGRASRSSPFLIEGNLGVREWLTQAWKMNAFLRSSREEDTPAGLPAKPFDGGSADVMSYHIQFKIVSSISVAPSWTLVRISTPSSPLFDTNRTRTHELLITIGPGAKPPKVVAERAGPTREVAGNGGPSDSASQVHNAQLIGSAVANAIRSR